MLKPGTDVAPTPAGMDTCGGSMPVWSISDREVRPRKPTPGTKAPPTSLDRRPPLDRPDESSGMPTGVKSPDNLPRPKLPRCRDPLEPPCAAAAAAYAGPMAAPGENPGAEMTLGGDPAAVCVYAAAR